MNVICKTNLLISFCALYKINLANKKYIIGNLNTELLTE